jgi:hypothetical protein
MSFRYDVFISYSHEDRAWAHRIRDNLDHRGLKAFVDERALRAGTAWAEELRGALDGSQHLIVLSSQASRGSRWVEIEFNYFRHFVRGDSTPRRIIPVILDDQLEIYEQFQLISEIRQRDGYTDGPEALDPEIWSVVMDKLVDTIGSADVARRVPILVVTTTLDAMKGVDPSKPILSAVGDAVTLNELIDNLGVDWDALLARYGDNRRQWRPFGSELTVRTILDGLEDEINDVLAAANLQRFRWDYLDEEFWSSSSERSKAAGHRLAQEPSLIVLDPIALYDELVRVRTNGYLIPEIRENDKAVVMVLPPFAMPAIAYALRKSISLLAYEFFNAYRNPPVFKRVKYARYVTSVGDEVDLKAWLLTGLGPALAGDLSHEVANAYLRTGT